MNDPDTPFEEALRQSLAARTEDLDIPEGLGRGAIRRARRRVARKVAMVGVPAVVVVAVALIVVVSGGHRASHPAAINASDVVRRVSARVKMLGPSDGVVERVTSSNKQRTPLTYEWQYTDPHNRIFYDFAKYFNLHGTYDYGYWDRDLPLGGNRVKSVAFQISPIQKTWGIDQRTHRVHDFHDVGLESSAHGIQRALKKGRVHLRGQTTVRGIKSLRLELKNAIRGGSTFLYVDASTYQPIEEVVTYRYPRRHHLVIVDRLFLLPATTANIARATDRPDLKGYMRR